MTVVARVERSKLDPGILFAEISCLASSERVTRVLSHWVNPELAFLEIFGGEPHAAWLDAGDGAQSGWSYLCGVGEGGYLLKATPSAGSVTVRHLATSRSSVFRGTLLDALDAVRLPGGGAAGAGFDLGWVGWVGYESGAAALGLPFARSDRPDSALLFVDRLITFDHERRRVLLQIFSRVEGASEWLSRTEDRLADLHDSRPALPEPPHEPLAPARLRHSTEEYRSLIVECQAEIADGEAYQLCLTNQISTRTDADPLTVYRRLRRLNPTPRGGVIIVEGTAIVSSSPELFLRVTPSGHVETRPIKGTRPRGATADADELLREELLSSEKERAENVMIVDLMRNDFTRIARLGSVTVEGLFAIERYATMFQLVSTVTAQLAEGETAISAIRSAFPAGSMTGAPKARAMTILRRLERGPRGAYAGAFGFIAVGGHMELTMTIRTAVIDIDRRTAVIGAGGGITALSRPSDEVDEMLLKAQPMLTALGARIVTRQRPERAPLRSV